MKLERFDIILDRQNATYLAGETITGTLLICSDRTLTAAQLGVKLIGQAHTGWVTKTEVKVMIFESNEELFNDYFDVMPLLSGGGLLPQGEQTFRFQMNLPLDLISSIYNENFGWVRYTLTATLKVSEQGFFAQLGGNNEVDTEKAITVYAQIDLDAVPNLRQPANA
uniref:Arrestin-like N-terminal domain-containing protein n=1 Tax=Plectus sambesii TaxID=2011161 RepID=A0A914WMU5_9BILA